MCALRALLPHISSPHLCVCPVLALWATASRMLRTLALALCVAAASAFAPAQLPLRSRQVSSTAPVCAMQGPGQQIGKGMAAAALLFSMNGPMTAAPAFADVAANPYAKVMAMLGSILLPPGGRALHSLFRKCQD